MKQWTRSDTIALAFQLCATCHGSGLRIGRRGGINPCNCVLRAVFRICYNRFRFCVTKEKHLSRATLEYGTGGKDRRYLWSRKDEEYIADFFLVSKRTLSEPEWQVFRFHFLLGADWKLCCRRLAVDRGNFFHMVYRIEQKLGRTFRELEPYALFPLDDYFHGALHPEPHDPLPGPPAAENGHSAHLVIPIRAQAAPPVVEIPEERAA
ncbi:MAG: hypothetical protein HY235_06950 [Acidobacteria bacterium]|nr:hypothetical protein [Acidobacteriota bacterium]